MGVNRGYSLSLNKVGYVLHRSPFLMSLRYRTSLTVVLGEVRHRGLMLCDRDTQYLIGNNVCVPKYFMYYN